jgi:3-methylfumaryl-CoA hydratase
MAEAARSAGCRGDQCSQYRLTAPLFDYQGMVVSAVQDHGTVTTAVRAIHGRHTASGTLRSTSQ